MKKYNKGEWVFVRYWKDKIRCGQITGRSNFEGSHEVEIEENGMKAYMNLADDDVSRYARDFGKENI